MRFNCLAVIAATIIAARIIAIAISLGLWFWTQWLLSRRKPSTDQEDGAICDGIHRLTAPINRRLLEHPRRANALLISSSLVIDLLGLYLLGSAIFGSTIEPFLGLLILFALRQFCQAFCPLPCPPGMIWRKPGFPTLLVTYGTCDDLFFSGHTAIAVYGAAFLASAFGPLGIALGCAIALFEISAVLVLRAHYTMDVFAGAITALYVHRLAMDWAPTIDGWIGHAITLVGR
jgi:PAP2 superfamily